jgi:FkbM family methyltransferase
LEDKKSVMSEKTELFRKLRRAITFIEYWHLFTKRKRVGISPDLYIQLDRPFFTSAGIKTVLDIGAHTGIWAKTVQLLLPDVTTYSFEPVFASFNSLKKRMHGINTHKAFNIALGKQAGEYDFYLNDFSATSSFYPVSHFQAQVFPYSANSRKIKVRVERLDDFLSKFNLEKELFIKVDVQGFENEVIEGGKEIFGKAKIVLIEVSFEELYKGQKLFEHIYTQMINMGFKYTGNLDQLANPRNGKYMQADAIFISGKY